MPCSQRSQLEARESTHMGDTDFDHSFTVLANFSPYSCYFIFRNSGQFLRRQIICMFLFPFTTKVIRMLEDTEKQRKYLDIEPFSPLSMYRSFF